MIYVAAAESGDGAIIDISLEDSKILNSVCREVFSAAKSTETLTLTGYTGHAYKYLMLWLLENRPGGASQFVDGPLDHLAFMRTELGSATDSELLLATKISDIDADTVRWKFNLEALLMFDIGCREVLDFFTPGLLTELPMRTGYDEEDLGSLQQELKDILAAVDMAAQQGKPIK